MKKLITAVALLMSSCLPQQDPVKLVVSPTLYDYAVEASENVHFPVEVIAGYHRCGGCSWAYYDPTLLNGTRMTPQNGYALIQVSPQMPYRDIAPKLEEYLERVYNGEVLFQLYP